MPSQLLVQQLAALVPYYLNVLGGQNGTGNPVAVATGAWPFAILNAQSATQKLTVIKRVVLDYDLANTSLLTAIGLTVCPPGKTPKDVPGCLQVTTRHTNQNPTFVQVLLARGEIAISPSYTADLWQEVPQHVVETLAPGEKVRILPVLADGTGNCVAWSGCPPPQNPPPPCCVNDVNTAYESYELFRSNLQTGAVEVIQATEEPSVAWFCSDGDLQNDVTSKFTKNLSNVYTAPSAPPAKTGGKVNLWLVARDGRGGEEWFTIDNFQVVAP
jgi:hypothetical protein